MPERESSFYAALGGLSAIITIIPASMAAGWMLGHYVVDRYLGTGPWGTIVLILIGAATGFYEIIRILIPSQRKADRPPAHERH